ncbi:MAG TPA: FtsX-like permease family protein [Hyphomicrobiaceae bacterium]|nr:FtsX-like permease family protein [Hyphomicrobiaceae bacterium]
MSSIEAPAAAQPAAGFRLPLVLRFALREMRTGLKGFGVFVACVALGVGAITGVGALSDALNAGFEAQGEVILGGDITLSRMHRRASAEERNRLEQWGRVSETATMRASARTLDESEQALIELKAVDGAYPLVGAVELEGGRSLDALTRAGGAAVHPILLERLGVAVGDSFRLGSATVPILGIVAREPDTISDRVTYGARVFVSLATLETTGLVQPGSLVRWRYALSIADRSTAGLAAVRELAQRALAEAGFIIADRRDPSPQVTRTLERLRRFLTLVGLTALLVGGVGVANAVATFIDRRRKVIATYKSVGANGRTIFAIFLTQVLLIAAIGIVLGLALGLLVPFVLDTLYGEALPIRAVITVSPWSLLIATVYGILVSLLFALWPLGRAETVRAGVLFREEVADERQWPKRRIVALTILAGVALVAFAILSSGSTLTAIYFTAAVVVVFAVFIAFGTLVTMLARRMPRPKPAEVALAVGNIGAPGGLTRSVVLSLGAGLSLLVAVALTDASLLEELSTRLPQQSPNYFVLDIPKGEREAFGAVVHREAPEAVIDDAPMLRGRIVRVNGTPAEEIKASGDAEWVLRGDRGLTFSDTLPKGSRVVAGAWWPADHEGEALVSFEDELAARLGLGVGDTVTVNVLGRNLTARIANLREVKWENMTINFVMVFSPNTLKAAPYNLLATITLPKEATLAQEAQLARALAKAFPSVTTIRVKDAVNAFEAVFAKVMVAVRVAGSVTLAAGGLVLAGALATAQRRRIKQAVILKTIGATRRRILVSHFVEYLLLACLTAALATLLGSIAAWIAVTQVMELEFSFSGLAVVEALAIAIGLVAALGGLGTWQVLRAPAVPYLRSE